MEFSPATLPQELTTKQSKYIGIQLLETSQDGNTTMEHSTNRKSIAIDLETPQSLWTIYNQ
jgi:hypothetical protein